MLTGGEVKAKNGASGNNADELFELCDTNVDGKISPKELKKCANFPGFNKNIAKQIFIVFDTDQDGFLSRLEYHNFVARAIENAEKDDDEDDENEEVEVIDRDGKKKTMKKSEFEQLNKGNMQGLSIEDGEMTKLDEGETTLEKAREENPELARVIAMGKWIEAQLAEMKYATGNIMNIKTIDSRENGENEQRKMHNNQDFQARISWSVHMKL